MNLMKMVELVDNVDSGKVKIECWDCGREIEPEEYCSSCGAFQAY